MLNNDVTLIYFNSCWSRAYSCVPQNIIINVYRINYGMTNSKIYTEEVAQML